MAVKLVFSRSYLFVVWITLTIILSPQKRTVKLNNEANNVYISSRLNIKHFPSCTCNSGLLHNYHKESYVAIFEMYGCNMHGEVVHVC